MIAVKYSRFELYRSPSGGGLDRPCLAVRLQHGGAAIDTFGLVDSAADGSLFHVDFARALGLTLDPSLMEDMYGCRREVTGLEI